MPIPTPLIKDAVYQTPEGPLTFRCIDSYYGDTTYKFEKPDGNLIYASQRRLTEWFREYD